LIVSTTVFPCTGARRGAFGDSNFRPWPSRIVVIAPGTPRSSVSSASSRPSTATPLSSTRPTMRRVPWEKAYDRTMLDVGWTPRIAVIDATSSAA
jgi:hypothetical protein